MSRRHASGLAVLAVLVAAAAGLLAYELAAGARDYGTDEVANPCSPQTPFPGDGFDATLQRIALDGLSGAACELGTTREALVLSFEPQSGVEPIPWDVETTERALRSGFLRAIDEAEARDDLGSLPATILREIVERAPLDWLIRGGDALSDLLRL